MECEKKQPPSAEAGGGRGGLPGIRSRRYAWPSSYGAPLGLGLALPVDIDDEVASLGIGSLPGDFFLRLLKIFVGLVPAFNAKVFFSFLFFRALCGWWEKKKYLRFICWCSSRMS